jgi:hypothetical protein
MPKVSLIISIFLASVLADLNGQATFSELVARTFGTDQELVNGIQFSNHYGRIDGHPYFLDERFRTGSVYVNNQLYEPVMLRYNLYSQKVEIEYRTIDGNLNQYMSVPELMPSFSMEGYNFRHMEFPGEAPGYYLEVSTGEHKGYIGWRKELELAHGSSSDYEFTAEMISYWLVLEQQPAPFHNRKTFLEIFPAEIRSDLAMLLKARKYSFKHPSVHEAVEMIRAALQVYVMESSQ